MRVVILADSLGRPRPDLAGADRTRYEEVYGTLLRRRLGAGHEVDLCYVESLDSGDAVHWSERMVAFREPDVAVFQIGINDCAPRVFPKNSRSLLHRPWFRKLTFNLGLRIIHRFRHLITRWRPLTYFTEAEYEANFRRMIGDVLRYSPAARFFALGICHAGGDVVRRSSRANENADRFNAVLRRVFGEGFIDLNALVPDPRRMIADGIHLTPFAHAAVAAELERRIRALPAAAGAPGEGPCATS